MGLHQAIALCVDHCYSAELAGNNDWYKTVVLSGGTACLPGLAGLSLSLSRHFTSLQQSRKMKCNYLRFLILLLGLLCFRKVRKGTPFITSSLYVQWN